jgi:hypothetical protein
MYNLIKLLYKNFKYNFDYLKDFSYFLLKSFNLKKDKKYGFDKILWPYRYLCIVDYAANSKGAVDSQKVVQIEHFKS